MAMTAQAPKKSAESYVRTTILLTPEQHRWMREEAMRRVKATEKPDASAIFREWVEREMKRKPPASRRH